MVRRMPFVLGVVLTAAVAGAGGAYLVTGQPEPTAQVGDPGQPGFELLPIPAAGPNRPAPEGITSGRNGDQAPPLAPVGPGGRRVDEPPPAPGDGGPPAVPVPTDTARPPLPQPVSPPDPIGPPATEVDGS